MKNASKRIPEKPLNTLEMIFILSSLICYGLPFVIYWVLDTSINQEIMLFFGMQMVLFICLMLYGSIKGLSRGKASRMHKARYHTHK